MRLPRSEEDEEEAQRGGKLAYLLADFTRLLICKILFLFPRNKYTSPVAVGRNFGFSI
jgi:hypothetical protein